MRTLTIEVDEALYEALAAAGPTPEEAAARALARAGSADGDGWSIWAELCGGVVELGRVADYAGTIDDDLYGPKACPAE